MSFLHPQIFWALAAVGLPAAIHLINKLRVRETRWAAMRFLAESLRTNQRRLRLEDLLLLVLRCLLVAAAVVAFTGPVRRLIVPGGSGDGPVAAVILLDDSASMGQSDGVVTRFEQAKAAIRDRLDHAEPNSAYALFVVSDQADALVAKPTPDLAQLRHSLDLAQLGNRGSDLSTGIRAAYDALQPLGDRPREIDVYTDGQASAWSRREEIRRLQQANPGVSLRPVILGKHGEDNLGITALSAEGGMAAANQPCRFQVDVGNFGAQAAAGVRVSIAVDGGAPSDEALIPQIESGATQSVGLLVRFPAAGPHSVTAALGPDRLAVDNRRTTAVSVVGRTNALVLEGGNAAAKMDRDGFFLANALVPSAGDPTVPASLHVTLAPAGGLNQGALAVNDLVFLCNPGVLPPDAGATLRDYVFGGGNLVIFPGPLTDPVRLQQDKALWSLLPATPGPANRPGPATLVLHWQRDGFDHPVTALWNDPDQGSLAGIQATGYFPLTLRTAADNPGKGNGDAPRAVVRYTNGAPAVAEWACGRGSVVLFSSTATAQWTDLPLHPVFVPLIQRLLGYLSRRQSPPLAIAPGTRFQAVMPIELLGKNFAVVGPEENARKREAGQVELDGEQAVIRYSDTDAVGAYRLFVGDEETPRAVFAVQLDPAESDLRQIDPHELEALVEGTRGKDLAATAGPPAGMSQLAVKREFWTPLIWLAVAAAAAEFALAQRYSRSR